MGGSEPFVGMLLLVPYNFAPAGWVPCDGRLLPISENDALFSLIGTTYGGDGQTTFAVPDLRSRVPVGQGAGYTLGQTGGTETVTLTLNEYPAHTHQLLASGQAQNSNSPQGHVLAAAPVYATAAPNATMASAEVSLYGGSQPHENRQPFLALTWIISLFGVFPSQS